MNQEKTAVDCYAHGARYYDPQLAVWHSSDPLAELYTNFSPYNYVVNNPVNFIDPNGMSYGPSQDERDKINEGGHYGGFGFGPGVRRIQADPNSWNNVGRFMSNPGPGVPYTDENGNTYETKQDPVTGEMYYTIEYVTDWYNKSTLEYMYTTPGGSEKVPIASNGGGDPYQNSHGEKVYSMDEFLNANQGLTRNEIINQRQDRSISPLKSQPGGPYMRYVINPHDGRVLDMRHMLVVGKYPSTVGNFLEFGQYIADQASGMDRQDFYSNRVGYQFYRQDFPLMNIFAPRAFTKQLGYYFNNPRRIVYW